MSAGLNEQQRVPAEHLVGDVFVAAGAGSGKTRMLTQRFVNAIAHGAVPGWEPTSVDEVLAITFTEKAAGEIAERVRLALAAAGETDGARAVADAWISTIHGLCSRLLRRHPFEAGVDPDFAVADTVLAAQLQAGAFEEAAAALLETEAGVELFERYPFSQLFEAAVAVTRELAVVGCSSSAIDVEPGEAYHALLGEAVRLFDRGCGSCSLDYSGTSLQPIEHAEQCREFLSRCDVLRESRLGEREALEALLGALVEYKPAMRVLKEFFGEQREMAAALRGRVVAALVAPDGELVRRLIIKYGERYAARKADLGVLDFDDLQLRAVRLFEDNPRLAAKYSRKFRLVMVDEFQDTDSLQLRLIDALAHGRLCTVGDENQSIYRFRGAEVDLYRARREDVRGRGALVTQLDVNYRSHPDVLGFVNGVFGTEHYFDHALLRLKAAECRESDERWRAVFADAPRTEVLLVDSTEADSDAVRKAQPRLIAERIAELCAGGANPSDVAILVRRYARSHEFAQALALAGVASVVVGGSRFYALPEIAVMRAITRVVANPEDGSALGVLLAMDFVPVTSNALAMLRVRDGAMDRRPLWRLVGDVPQGLPEPDREAIERLRLVIERARARHGLRSLADILLATVEEAGWDLRLLSQGSTGRDAFANVLKFIRQAGEFEQDTGQGAAAFGRHVDLREALGDVEAPASLADDHSQAVRIMSIHASKGLEFPIVVVPDLQGGVDNRRPLVRFSRRKDSVGLALGRPASQQGGAAVNSAWFEAFDRENRAAEAAETDRLLYVAFTRARECLIVSGATGLRTARPSQATHQLAKLIRALGVEIPVPGAMDVRHPLPGSGIACRLRVLDPSELREEAPVGVRDSSAAVRMSQLPVLPPCELVEELGADTQLPDRLSYTLLAEFEHCPRRFYARRVLGVRSPDVTAIDDAGTLGFGVALHSVLRLVSEDGGLPPAERISAIARYFELSDAQHSRLVAAASRYVRSEIGRRAASGEVVRRECPFALPIGEGFMLRGSIDLYSRTGESALIVDYKSGESDGGESDLRGRYRLQAECYALAALKDGCRNIDVEFVRPEVLGEDGESEHVHFEFSKADEARVVADLRRRFEEIRQSDFAPNPTMACATCDVVRGVCPQAGSAEGARRAG